MTTRIIGDDTPLPSSVFDGRFGRGLIPRDFGDHPMGSFAPPAEIATIPRSEWSERIRTMEQTRSRLSDLRDHACSGQPIPSLNQGPWGYCWSHGPVAAMLLLRAAMNAPYVPLSAFGVAYTIKNGRDEGAWGALALDFLRDRGAPTAKDWPAFQTRLRPANDPCWQTARDYRVTAGWMELNNPVWDRDLTIDQVMTCLFNRIPVVGDFNWWGHCVCLMDPVEVSPGRFGVRIWNSWGDDWESNGTAILTDSRMIPDNAVAPAAVLA
jgi:hypothetical protein